MERMTDYLKNWREEMPSWLANYHPGDHVEFSDFMGGRVGYYPGSYFDGCLIKTANRAHCVHAFLYVDYGVTREEVEQELCKENALLGYHSIGRVEWPFEDIMPNGYFHIPSEYAPMIENRLMLVEEGVNPFCIMEVYERNDDKDGTWGAQRLALTYLFADGITAYYELFVNQYEKEPWLFLLQDHGLGGNYNKFGKGGILDKIIQRYDIFPDFVIRDIRSTSMWEGYQPIGGVSAVFDGMHWNARILYQSDKMILRTLPSLNIKEIARQHPRLTEEGVTHNLSEDYLQSLTEEERIRQMKEWTPDECLQYLCSNGTMTIEEFRALGHKLIDEEYDRLGWE